MQSIVRLYCICITVCIYSGVGGGLNSVQRGFQTIIIWLCAFVCQLMKMERRVGMLLGMLDKRTGFLCKQD
jgi:hypothetical protein